MLTCWLQRLPPTPTYSSSSSSRVLLHRWRLQDRTRPRRRPLWWCCRRCPRYLPHCRPATRRRHCPGSARQPASTSACTHTATPPTRAHDTSRRWPPTASDRQTAPPLQCSIVMCSSSGSQPGRIRACSVWISVLQQREMGLQIGSL